MWTTIYTDTVEGFDIDVSITPEQLDPREHFDDDEIIEGIAEGYYDWFIVRVTASRHGIELGNYHLGGNCYEDPRELIQDEYHTHMVREAIAEARANIKKLTEGLCITA